MIKENFYSSQGTYPKKCSNHRKLLVATENPFSTPGWEKSYFKRWLGLGKRVMTSLLGLEPTPQLCDLVHFTGLAYTDVIHETVSIMQYHY